MEGGHETWSWSLAIHSMVVLPWLDANTLDGDCKAIEPHDPRPNLGRRLLGKNQRLDNVDDEGFWGRYIEGSRKKEKNPISFKYWCSSMFVGLNYQYSEWDFLVDLYQIPRGRFHVDKYLLLPNLGAELDVRMYIRQRKQKEVTCISLKPWIIKICLRVGWVRFNMSVLCVTQIGFQEYDFFSKY